MDGRPLLEAFEIPPEVKTIQSWEKVPGKSGMHSGTVQMDPDQAQELMQQFAALGYIEDPGLDKEKAAESADIEAKYNISRTYLWKSEPALHYLCLKKSYDGGRGKTAFSPTSQFVIFRMATSCRRRGDFGYVG